MPSQIRTKQIEDGAITSHKLSGEAIWTVLNTKKIGNSRIILNIDVTTGTSEIDITEKIYDASYHSEFSLDGVKRGVLTTGAYVSPLGDVKGKGFENYKIWVRSSGSRLAINNNINNNEVFAELYVKEYKKVAMHPYQKEIVETTQNENEAIISNIEPTTFDINNYLSGIICVWNGNDDNSDRDLGFITEVNDYILGNRMKVLTFKENCPISYNGQYKTLKYFLKFKTYDNNGDIIDFTFTSSTSIDIMFIESVENIYELTTNLYDFVNFFKIIDMPVPATPNYIEEQMKDESGSSNIVGTGVDFEGREYVDFKVNENEYKEGSLQVFIDGVRIFRYETGDSLEARRFYETNPSEGIFRIVNFTLDDLLTEEVFVRFTLI